jgi:hypothetical protein
MKTGDLVRTRQRHSVYGYERPVCVIVAKKTRIDGMYFEIVDPEGDIQRWWPGDLETVNESE